MKDLGLLVLRATAGGLLAGHGAQKLFGSFGGHGIDGTGGWLEGMGLRPGHRWAMAAGVSEFGGGVLTALGLGGGIGPAISLGAMAMATGTVHAGKPIWAAEGGAELPVVNMAAATTLMFTGPGMFSLDGFLRLFGIKFPAWMTGVALGATIAGVVYGLNSRTMAPSMPTADTHADHEEAPEGGQSFTTVEAPGSMPRAEEPNPALSQEPQATAAMGAV
jgi:putative oxidoreductase